MEKLRALRNFPYSRRGIVSGSEFEATPVDAEYLIANGQAERVKGGTSAPASAPVKAPQTYKPAIEETVANDPVADQPAEDLVMTARPRRAYTRRDVTAEK